MLAGVGVEAVVVVEPLDEEDPLEVEELEVLPELFLVLLFLAVVLVLFLVVAGVGVAAAAAGVVVVVVVVEVVPPAKEVVPPESEVVPPPSEVPVPRDKPVVDPNWGGVIASTAPRPPTVPPAIKKKRLLNIINSYVLYSTE